MEFKHCDLFAILNLPSAGTSTENSSSAAKPKPNQNREENLRTSNVKSNSSTNKQRHNVKTKGPQKSDRKASKNHKGKNGGVMKNPNPHTGGKTKLFPPSITSDGFRLVVPKHWRKKNHWNGFYQQPPSYAPWWTTPPTKSGAPFPTWNQMSFGPYGHQL